MLRDYKNVFLIKRCFLVALHVDRLMSLTSRLTRRIPLLLKLRCKISTDKARSFFLFPLSFCSLCPSPETRLPVRELTALTVFLLLINESLGVQSPRDRPHWLGCDVWFLMLISSSPSPSPAFTSQAHLSITSRRRSPRLEKTHTTCQVCVRYTDKLPLTVLRACNSRWYVLCHFSCTVLSSSPVTKKYVLFLLRSVVPKDCAWPFFQFGS